MLGLLYWSLLSHRDMFVADWQADSCKARPDTELTGSTVVLDFGDNEDVVDLTETTVTIICFFPHS